MVQDKRRLARHARPLHGRAQRRVAALNIDTPLRELGGFDSTPLRDAILCQDDAAWNEDIYRQEQFDVHQATQSIVVLFVNLDRWPELVVSREPGWPRLAQAALPLMNQIIEKHYPRGGTVIRAMAAKLRAGGIINPHVDKHPSFHIGHRVHIPITTNSRVRFLIDGQPYKFEIGQAYEINNQKTHSVMNKGSEDRITFIFDYVPPERVADGKPGRNRVSL